MDLPLPMVILNSGDNVPLVLGSLVVISVRPQGFFIIPLIPIMGFYYVFQKWFVATVIPWVGIVRVYSIAHGSV